jgi:O-antigen/teichoic acid export membrane protein
MTPVKALTGKKLLAKNIGSNFIIQGLTVLIAIFSVPPIIQALGIERYGILTIMWSVIGYSSLFDLGLGRALTRVISGKLGAGRADEIPVTIWTSLFVILVLSLIATLLMLAFSESIVSLMRVSPIYFNDARDAMFYLSLCLPFLIGIMGLKGTLEAYQKFNITNLLRLPILFFNYIAPLMVFPFVKSLTAMVVVLVLGRVLTFFAHLIAVDRVVPGFRHNIGFCKKQLGILVNIGKWITVSNLISPLMSYMDRLFVSRFLTAQVVAFYSTPYDTLSKMSIVPTAIMSVMFPAITAEFAGNDRARSRKLYRDSLLSISLILILPVLAVVFFSKPLLLLWLKDPVFANNSWQLTALLAIGFFFNSVNTVPFAALQACGRADFTAKLHLLELPIYLVTLYFGIHHFGILGAPIAFLIRIIIDSFVLHVMALRSLSDINQNSALVTPLPNKAFPTAS